MNNVGVQLMMVRHQVAADGMTAVLGRIADLGYTSVEVSQIPMDEDTTAALERAPLDFGISVDALSVALQRPEGGFIDGVFGQLDKIVDDCGRLSCSYVRIGMMPFEAMTSLPACEEWAAECERAAAALAEHQITLCYHNHHIDLARFGAEMIFDVVRRVAPSVHFEVDVHWVQRGGMNPIDMLNRYAGVTDLIHLKDYRVRPPSPELLELRAAGRHEEFATGFSCGVIEFAEVGAGTMNWPQILPAALAAGAQHFFVEQDDTYGRDPFDCLADSRAYLRSIGW